MEKYRIFNVKLEDGEKEAFREWCEERGHAMTDVLAQYMRSLVEAQEREEGR